MSDSWDSWRKSVPWVTHGIFGSFLSFSDERIHWSRHVFSVPSLHRKYYRTSWLRRRQCIHAECNNLRRTRYIYAESFIVFRWFQTSWYENHQAITKTLELYKIGCSGTNLRNNIITRKVIHLRRMHIIFTQGLTVFTPEAIYLFHSVDFKLVGMRATKPLHWKR